MPDTFERLSAALADRYRLERQVGEGGMATVYLAEDLKHHRNVALKVLKPELSAVIGAERFLAEITTTANLQHPHILPLHDSGEVDGTVFYVMPFVEGESLRDRLDREKQLSIADSIRIATEVAGALDYAHRHDVVHRDIKPENILLNEEGLALVADFGIALAASKSEGSTRMTETGMSLGTPHYMSPEQAMGERALDARTDEYALGCVLYEMLTGEPPFTGPTAQAVVARVMTEEPRGITIQRKTVPLNVESAVVKALSKLPADRFESAKAFALALAGPDTFTAATTAARPAAARPGGVMALAPWAIAVLGIALAAWSWMGRSATESTRWSYLSLGDTLAANSLSRAIAISPDGENLVIVDSTFGGPLWLKRRDELNAVMIPGTERAGSPIFSPDGEWIAFTANGSLKKVRTDGGAVITLADSTDTSLGGVAWLDDGSLVFVGPTISRLSRVGAAGGESTIIMQDTTLAGFGIGLPTGMPDGRGVLFPVCSSGCVIVDIHVLDLESGEQKRLLEDTMDAWYLPTGHLLYVRRDGAALVVEFDLDRMETVGAAVPALEGVFILGNQAQLAWSPTGRLIYQQGGVNLSAELDIIRVDRAGNETAIDTSWFGGFNSFAIAPGGRTMAVGVGLTSRTLGIWLKQMDRGTFSRLSFGGQDRRPAWSPDGEMVAFIRDSGNGGSVFTRRADGSSTERRLATLDRKAQEVIWSPDGEWIVMRTDNGERGVGDIVGLRLNGDTVPAEFASSRFTEMHPSISPDSRWLAYRSNESGVSEVYVRPFEPGADRRWQISNGGGGHPRWSADGRELFFFDNDGQLVAARIQGDPNFAVISQEVLFDATRFYYEEFHQPYDVLPDGSGFVFMEPRSSGGLATTPPLVEVTNWFADLKARLEQ